MSGTRHRSDGRVVAPGSARHPAWLVLKRELAELWVGGKALLLLTLFAIMLGITAYLLATNNELRLMPIKEIAYLMLKLTIAVGLFSGLVIAADSISGERERGTLEGLLLTPTKRRDIVIGKFLAAISLWLAAYALSAPRSSCWSATVRWRARHSAWAGCWGPSTSSPSPLWGCW